jgi:hypothetical protein
VETALQGAIKRLDTWESLSPEVYVRILFEEYRQIIQIVKNFKEKKMSSIRVSLLTNEISQIWDKC